MFECSVVLDSHFRGNDDEAISVATPEGPEDKFEFKEVYDAFGREDGYHHRRRAKPR